MQVNRDPSYERAIVTDDESSRIIWEVVSEQKNVRLLKAITKKFMKASKLMVDLGAETFPNEKAYILLSNQWRFNACQIGAL